MWDDSVGKLKSKRNRQNKPYERPKSLLRRVTDSVTGLLPQPAWLSSWLKPDKLEENYVAAERKDGVFPLKAATLTGKATLNTTSNSIGQESFIYSRPAYAQPTSTQQRTENQPNGNAILDDSLPGPSGLHLSQHPMASTPAPTPEKSGPGHAVAKEDESNSESTSGCSSLVPHPDKKDPQSTLSRPGPGSALNVDEAVAPSLSSQVSKPSASVNQSKTGTGALSKGRKCLNLPGSSNAVLATSEATQEPDESIQEPIEKQSSLLVMDRSTSYIEPQASALSSKRPRFSISAFGSPPQAKEGVSAISSILHSPFYAGKTTYGGASAYRRARLNVSTPYNISQRQQVQVKSKGPVVLSNTAQRILEALESMSTPIRDAKKIPTPAKATSFSTRLSETSKSVTADDTFTGFGAGLLSWSQRRRPKLSTTAPAATPAGPPVGKLATTTPVRVEKLPAAPLPTEVSHFGSSAAGGKMRTKVTAPVRESLASKAEAAEEEEAAIPDLPNIPLPIKKLPTFSLPFTLPTTATTTAAAPPSTSSSNMTPVSIKSKFTFSAPIKEAECPSTSTPSLKIGFKFSAPISALDQNGVSTSLPSKEVQFKVTETPKAAPAKRVSFGITGDDEVTPSKGTWTSKELVSGSVMDILGGKKSASGFGDAFKPKADTWECSACLVRNERSKDKCVACETSKPGSSAAFTATKPFTFSTPTTAQTKSAIATPLAVSTPFAGFGNQFKPAADEWECSACMIRNKKDATKCAACETPKPGASKAEPADPISTPKPFSGFGDKFKPSADLWECSVCMVRNKSEASKCVACETPKPGAAQPQTDAVKVPALISSSGFGDKFKPAADTWECSVCMVRNKSSVTSCASCESPKPGTLPSTPAAPFKFGVKSAETSGFKFGVPSATSATSTTSATETTSGFKFGVTVPTSTTASTTPTVGFKFGVPAAAAATDEKKTETSAPAFKFGVASTEEAPKSSTDSTQADSAAPTFTFGAGKPFVPKLKPSEPAVEATSPLKPPAELKIGSVMDILGVKKTVEATSGAAKTSTATVSVPSVTAPSFSLGQSKPADAPAPAFSFGLAATPSTTPSVSSAAPTPSFSFGTAVVKPAQNTEAGSTAPFTFTGTKRSVEETGSEEPAKKSSAFGQTPTPATATPSLGATAPSLAFPSVMAGSKPSETVTATSTAGGLFSFGATAPAAASVPASTGTFSFGTPAPAPAASTQSTTTPIFTFGAKDGGIKPGTGFGAPPAATATTQSTLSSFGTAPAFGKPAEIATTTAAVFSFGTATTVTTTVGSNPIFSFGSTPASTTTPTPGYSFGASAPSAAPTTTASTTTPFGSTGFTGFGTATPATTSSTHGFGFSAPTTTSSGFGGFGVTATTTNPPPAYGAFGTPTVTTTATTPAFGGFGKSAVSTTTTAPAFGGFGIPTATTTPAPAFGGFGAPVTTATAATPAFGGFGAAPATTTTAPASAPIFSFGASTKPAFRVSPAPSPVFGATPGGQPSSGLNFGSTAPSTTPLGGGLAFGAAPATTTVSSGGFSFGTPQAAPAFPSTPSFSFGQNQTQPAAPAGGVFHFGGQPSAAPAQGGFVFGGASTPATAPAPSQGGFAFNPSAPPSFAFGGGATPATPNFSANPFDATGAGSGVRRIRKATRRTGR